MKDTLKEFLDFFVVILYVFGVIAGLGFTIHAKLYAAAAAVVFLGAIAFPTFYDCVKRVFGVVSAKIKK